MVAPEAVSKPQISAAYAPSQAVLDAVEALEGARSALFDLQADAGVHVPLVVDLRLSGGRRPCHARASYQHLTCTWFWDRL